MSDVVSPSNPRKVLHTVDQSLSNKRRQVVIFEKKRPGKIFRTGNSEAKAGVSLQSTAAPEETTFYINPAYRKKPGLDVVEPGAILGLQKTLDHLGRQVLRRRGSSQAFDPMRPDDPAWQSSVDGSRLFATTSFDPRRKRPNRSTQDRKRAFTAAASRDFSLDNPSMRTDLFGLTTERTVSKSRGSAVEKENLILITSVDGRHSRLESLAKEPQESDRRSLKSKQSAVKAQLSADKKLLTTSTFKNQRSALRSKNQANKTLSGFGVSHQPFSQQQVLRRNVKTATNPPKDYDSILIERFNSLNKKCRFEHDQSRNLLQVYNSLMKKRPARTVETAFEPTF